ncbi:hypothetical protein PG990_013630 [Apiospora arundinis]|uniref:Polyketide synthase n=1 Tax=Apiospora arundinis TaxID=335852 RepID=A0ABR2IAJ3_9PEZI
MWLSGGVMGTLEVFGRGACQDGAWIRDSLTVAEARISTWPLARFMSGRRLAALGHSSQFLDNVEGLDSASLGGFSQTQG